MFVLFSNAAHPHTTHAPLSVQVLIFRHPKLFKDAFFPFVLIVIQPLLGAVLLHSLCCNTFQHALRELSVGLCRGNCVLYKRSLFALARVSGTAFRAGADIPTSEII